MRISCNENPVVNRYLFILMKMCRKVLILSYYFLLATTTSAPSIPEGDGMKLADEFTPWCPNGGYNNLLHKSGGLVPLNHTLRLRPIFTDSGEFRRGQVHYLMQVVMQARRTGNVIVLRQPPHLASESSEDVSDRSSAIKRAWNIVTGEKIPVSSVEFDNIYCGCWSKYIHVILADSFHSEEIFGLQFVSSIYSSQGADFFRNYTHPVTQENHEYFLMRGLWSFPTFTSHPEILTPFKIILARHKDQLKLRSVSNMDISHTENDLENENWIWDHFSVSPPISQDHVMAAIFDLAKTSVTYDEGQNKTVTFWTPENVIKQNEITLTLKRAAKILQFYEKEFMEYPVKTLDIIWEEIVASHQSFLGIVSAPYDDSYVSPTFSNVCAKRFIWNDLQTRIGSQWFNIIVSSRNPVSPHNGLPRYVARWFQEYLRNDSSDSKELALCEDWGWGDFEFKTFQRSPVTTLWMMQNVLNRDIMKTAISEVYLPKYKWRGLTLSDEKALFEAVQTTLEQELGKQGNIKFGLPNEETKLKDIFARWLQELPYGGTGSARDHILHVGLVDHNNISIRHEPPTTLANSTFWVPFEIYSAQGKKVDKLWFHSTKKSRNTTLSGIDTSQFLVVNPGRWAPYGVLYDDKLTELIVKQLKENFEVIPPKNRLQILNDNFLALEWNRGSIRNSLDLTLYLGNEASQTVWMTFLYRFRDIMKWCVNEHREIFQQFKSYMGPRLSHFLRANGGLHNVTWDNHVFGNYMYLLDGLQPIVKESQEVVSQWMTQNNPKFLFKNFDNTKDLICLAIRTEEGGNYDKGNISTWDFVMQEYKKLNDYPNYDKKVAIELLKCTRNVTRFETVLQMSLELNSSRDHHQMELFNEVYKADDPWMRQVQYDFAKKHMISREIKPEQFQKLLQDHFISNPCYNHRLAFVADLREVIQANKEYLGSRVVRNIRKSLAVNRVCRYHRFTSEINAWLDENVGRKMTNVK